MSVITGQQQDPPTSSLSLAGLTSTSIFQDDLGSVTIIHNLCSLLLQVKLGIKCVLILAGN